MKELKSKHFANGSVYCLELEDGKKIETTDTFLPYYTKDCINRNNSLQDNNLGGRSERWMIGVSTQSGCPIGCKFCATGKMKDWRNLTSKEICDQVQFIIRKNMIGEKTVKTEPKEFKINYTRMGEPFLNIDNVKQAIKVITHWNQKIHHYISTIGIKGSDFSWIKDNITLQISLHSFDEKRRNELIPINNLMTLEELGQIRTESNLKTTINLTLVDEVDFDIEKLKRYFDPEFFFIKLSPINKNEISESNNLGDGFIKTKNLL
jgi:23S rRNA (adenine2503-C2)-methyltransferase